MTNYKKCQLEIKDAYAQYKDNLISWEEMSWLIKLAISKYNFKKERL